MKLLHPHHGGLFTVSVWMLLLSGSNLALGCIELIEPDGKITYPATMQEALNKVESCSTIKVCADTLRESIVVRRPVTIQGQKGTQLMGVPGTATITVAADDEFFLSEGACPCPNDDSAIQSCGVSISDMSILVPQGPGGGQSALVLDGPAAVTLDRVELEALQQRPAPAPTPTQGLVQVRSGTFFMRDNVSLVGTLSWSLPILTAKYGAKVFFQGGSIINAPGGDGMVLRSSRLVWQESSVKSAGGRALDLVDGSVSIGSSSINRTGEDCLKLKDATAELQSVSMLDCGGNGLNTISSEVQVKDVTVDAAGEVGVVVVGGTLFGTGLTVSNVQRHGIAVHGEIADPDDRTVDLDGLTISAVGQSGMFLSSFANVNLKKVSITSPGRNGLELEASSLVVDGLFIDGPGDSGLDASKNSYIYCHNDCRILGAHDGVLFSHSDGVFSDAYIGAMQTAVGLEGQTRMVLINSVLSGGVVGLNLAHDESSADMKQVDILQSSENAVRQSAGKLLWSGGTAKNAGLDGVHVSGGSIDLASVTLIDHEQNGIFITGKVDATLVQVHLQGNGLHGLSCDGSVEDILSSNVSLGLCYYSAKDNGLDPIYLINGCQQNVCTEGVAR